MDVTLFSGNLTQTSSGVDETRSLGQTSRSYTLTDPVAEVFQMGAAEPGRRAGLVRVGETDAIPQAYGIYKQPVGVDRGWHVYDPDIRDGELLAQFADGGIEEQSRLGNLGIIVKCEGLNRMLGIRFAFATYQDPYVESS